MTNNQELINLYRDELERAALNYARVTLTKSYLETYGDRPPEIVHLTHDRLEDWEQMFLKRMKLAAQDLLRQMTAEPLPERTSP